VTSKALGSRVKGITDGRGADLIFYPIAGDTLPTLAEAVAWGRQIILYGALGGTNVPRPLFAAFARNFTLRSYIIYGFCSLQPLAYGEMKKLSPGLCSERLKKPTDTWSQTSS
jgi:NADPH:quinone reductase-like Zn-dependent oxidoreductase